MATADGASSHRSVEEGGRGRLGRSTLPYLLEKSIDQDRPLSLSVSETPAGDVGARLAYLEGLLVKNGIPLAYPTSGVSETGIAQAEETPAPTTLPAPPAFTPNPHITHGQADVPTLQYRPAPPAATAPPPAVISPRSLNLDARSPVHSICGIPALAAAVDMVDDRPFSQDAHVELDSLREVGSHPSIPMALVEVDLSPHDLGSVPTDPGDDEGIGTLVMFPSGRAKFLGRTAGSEWLKNVSWSHQLGRVLTIARDDGRARITIPRNAGPIPRPGGTRTWAGSGGRHGHA